MKTEDLIGMLARDASPVPTRVGERRFAIALVIGVLLALAWVQTAFGIRADLGQVMATPAFWQKVAMPLAVAATGLIVVFRLGHPGARMNGWWLGVWLPVSLLWIWAAAVLWMAEPQARMPLVLGSTWRTCVFNVTATSLPIGAALLWALRGLAPTRPVLTGAAAGWLAGAVGACVYALHCPEMAAPFVAIWYVLGMGMSAALGAWAGRSWLRW
ncbi:NrsF family protein [Roseateles sp. So40a]|uniref:NrsF family protein n=1 Tax=Roseateles sp. So40a TaxID=3400226 RepID=UPI003A8B584D